MEEGKKKVENFLNPESARDKDRRERRRHGYDSGSRSLSRGRYESSEEEEYYERRQRR